MSPFTWNFRGIIAHNPNRGDVQEYYGWWRHIAFGICIYRKKSTPCWE